MASARSVARVAAAEPCERGIRCDRPRVAHSATQLVTLRRYLARRRNVRAGSAIEVERRVNRILAINSSISGEASVSRVLVEETVQRLLAAIPDALVTRRDLSDVPVPHLTPDTVAGIRAVARTEDELAAQALSDDLIAELQEATILVIGAPMYNFSISTTLRSWFDHVLRPRVTFSFSESGPQGLLTGIRAIVIQARGGLYSEGPGKVLDFQEPYLKQLLGFVGITDVAFVHAEKIGFGPEARDAAIAHARGQIETAVARIAAGGTAVHVPDETVGADHSFAARP